MVEYFNGIDETVRTLDKNHVAFAGTSEAYAKLNGGSPVDNPDYVENDELDAIKAKRTNEIDLKSQQLIAGGFNHNSINFSLTLNAQLNWVAIKARRNNNEISYPFKISTKGNSEHTFNSSTELDSFVDDGFNAVKGILDGGRALKIQINAATTMAEIKAIVDNR